MRRRRGARARRPRPDRPLGRDLERGADRPHRRAPARGDLPGERLQRVLPRAPGAPVPRAERPRQRDLHRLDRRPAWRGAPRPLRRDQGGAPVARDEPRGRARAADPRQRDLAGVGADADGGGRARATIGGRDRRRAPEPAGRRGRRRAFTPRSTSRARRPATSSARTWASPAARCSSCRGARSSPASRRGAMRFRHHVFVCENRRTVGPARLLRAKGSEAIRQAFKAELHRRGSEGRRPRQRARAASTTAPTGRPSSSTRRASGTATSGRRTCPRSSRATSWRHPVERLRLQERSASSRTVACRAAPRGPGARRRRPLRTASAPARAPGTPRGRAPPRRRRPAGRRRARDRAGPRDGRG